VRSNFSPEVRYASDADVIIKLLVIANIPFISPHVKREFRAGEGGKIVNGRW
jgi:hypothetical protein